MSKNEQYYKQYFKNEWECFIGVSKQEKRDEGRVLLFSFECIESPMKHEARVFKI